DELGAIRSALFRIANRIQMQSDAVEPETAPQTRQHDDLLHVDVRAGEAQGLDVILMKLAVASLLRTLVAQHRTRHPYTLWALVGEVVLDRSAHDAGGRLGTQGEALAVQPVLESVHLVLDDVGDLANGAHEQRRRFDDGRAHIAVAILREHFPDGVVEALPQRRVVGQHIVHAANGLNARRRHGYATALTLIDFFSGLR